MTGVLEWADVRDWLVVLGIIAAGLGFLLGSFRRGRGDAQDETISAQSTRITLLETDLAKEQDARRKAESDCSSQIASLEGRVHQLQEQNKQLESYVMGSKLADTVQAAMVDVVGRFATENREFYVNSLNEMMHPLLQGLDRLLTKGGDESRG